MQYNIKNIRALYILTIVLIFSSYSIQKQIKQKSMPAITNTNTNQLRQTLVTFIIPQEEDAEKQVIKFSLKITKQDSSLVDAIEQAKQIQKQLQDIFLQFCTTHEQMQHQQCQQLIETSNYEIQAEYYQLRGKQVFKNFIVTFQMSFISKAVKQIGLLIDQFSELMDSEKIVLHNISWEDLSDDTEEEEIIDQGIARARSSCANLGMDFYRVKSLHIYKGSLEQQKKIAKPVKKAESQDEQQEQQEEQQQQQASAEEQQQLNKFKFVVVCRQKQKTKNRKQPIKNILKIVKKPAGNKKQKILTE